MRGNSHVRFGARDEETCPGNGARRFIPTLPKFPTLLCLSPRNLPQLDRVCAVTALAGVTFSRDPEGARGAGNGE